MYQVNLGNNVLYYPASADACIYDTKLTEDVGMAGEFSFKVPPQNPYYSQLAQGELITIFRDGIEFWRGEIREIKTDFAKIANVYCLEDMAWLGDEFLTPAQITTDTYAQRFQAAIDAYNLNRSSDRQFTAGYITNVTNSSLCNWTTEYDMSILDSLRECICNASSDAGQIRVRRVTSGGTVTRYIDIVKLSDYGVSATQPIEYGYNLLDYVKDSDYSNLVNVLTPYGDELDSEVYDGYNQRLAGTTISEATSITAYGRHAKAVIFDGVDNLTDLNALAAAYLTRYSQPQLTMEVKAVDLAGIDSVDAISIGDSVRIIAKPFAVDQWLYLTEIRRDIQNIDKNTITLSGNVISGKTLTSQTLGTSEAVKNLPSKSSILDAAFKNVLALINGVDGGYVTFETNASDQITEIRIANNLDFDQATKAWRWNLGGLAYMSRDNTSDPWTPSVAMDMNGEMVANFIKTGELIANNGVYELNMATGYVKMGAGEFTGKITSSSGEIGGFTITSNALGDQIGSTNCVGMKKGDKLFTWSPGKRCDITMGQIYVATGSATNGIRVYNSSDYSGDYVQHGYSDIYRSSDGKTVEWTSSDERLKKNIEDLTLDEAKKLIESARPRKFRFKSEAHEKGERYGFIAQELREVLDDDSGIEFKNSHEYHNVHYMDFVAPLCKIVQDQQKQIDSLKNEINTLKGEGNG